MKIQGLTDAQIETITSASSAGTVVAVKKAGGPGWWEGYFQAKFPGYGTTKGGVKWYGTCLHWYVRFALELNAQHPTGGWTLTINGVHANPLIPIEGFAGLLAAKFSALGIACAHTPHNPAAPSTSITAFALGNAPVPLTLTAAPSAPTKANKTVKAPPKPAKPKVQPPPPPGELIEAPPIDAAPLPEGEITGAVAVAHVRHHVRPIYPAVTSMYLLEELYVAATKHVVPVNTDHEPAIAFARKLLAMHARFSHDLARNFFDFLTMAAFGEFRYGSKSASNSRYHVYVDGTEVELASRASAYAVAMTCDPRIMLPIIASAFRRTGWWGGQIGGKKWANIAEIAAKFYGMQHVPLVFADHVVDVQHNGGLAFNKHYLLGNPSYETPYKAMLDRKRAGTLLDSTLRLEVTTEVAHLVLEAVRLGVIPQPVCTLDPQPDVIVPALKWGTGVLTVRTKGGTPIPQEEPTSEEPALGFAAQVAPSAGHGTGTVTDLPPDA